MTIESNGGSSEYYQLAVKGGSVECLDVIEALGLNFAEGNILKALWRRSAARRGAGKAGTSTDYDARKIAFFAARLVAAEGGQGNGQGNQG
jgi:hypothetical protein